MNLERYYKETTFYTILFIKRYTLTDTNTILITHRYSSNVQMKIILQSKITIDTSFYILMTALNEYNNELLSFLSSFSKVKTIHTHC